MGLRATEAASQELGYFRIFATPVGGAKREITTFRGAPVMLNSVSWSDPFSDQTASLDLPQVTLFEAPGEGDLDWLAPDTDIDVVFQNTGSYTFDWRWEGYIAAFNYSLSGATASVSVDLKGAFYGLDDYLAKPSFPASPIPYEILIDKAFNQTDYPTRLGKFRMEFPSWWDTAVPNFSDPNYASYLKPWGVSTGQLWTGFTSRSTGSWEPMLTGFVQSLLSVMYAEGGSQWTIKNIGNRTPLLYVREIPNDVDPSIIDIQLGAPGVEFNASKDYTQRANVIYGQGTDDAGISYSGMSVSPNGVNTIYKPFAYAPQVYPRTDNPFYDPTQKAKEVMVRFQDGVDQVSAQKIALAQYQRFSEPGISGSFTLSTDPTANGVVVPRMLIKAGTTFRIKGLLGVQEGVLVHATQVDVDFQNLTTSVTFDSKYRDQLTVAEVQARTKDALTPLRKLQVGKYSNTVQDLLLPWSYKGGSGCIPEPAKGFFNSLPSTATFPYEEWTIAHPPSNPSYSKYYIRINPTNLTDSGKNWSGVARNGATILGFPIRMGQSGNIRLTQIAAYDKTGHVLPVKFHFSIYDNQGVGPSAMPQFSKDPDVAPGIPFLKPDGVSVNYNVGQANPFFKGAWEQYNEDGTQNSNDLNVPAQDAGLVVGWGNYYEPAGYSPGRFSKGAAKTGLLSDDSSWSWSTENYIDMYNPKNNTNDEYAGYLFVMIFCDEQNTQPVYFMGKLWREEPGVY